jgi:DNA-binding NarL/FixJ family response regulator
MEPYRIILADDHSLFRKGLQRILAEREDFTVIGETGDGLELVQHLQKLDPHLIVLDISMPGLRGIEAISEIRAARKNVKILILTMHKESDYLFQAITAGADGYLLKEDAERDLFAAIDAIRTGGIFVSPLIAEESMEDWVQIRRGERSVHSPGSLTVREREILKLIAEGKSSREIGDLLCISHRTVERHRANMMEKLNVKKTADLVRYAFRKGHI